MWEVICWFAENADPGGVENRAVRLGRPDQDQKTEEKENNIELLKKLQ